MNKKVTLIQISQNQLVPALVIINEKYDYWKRNTNKKIASLIRHEFNCFCSEQDIIKYYTLTDKEIIKMEQEEKKIIYENFL